MPVIAPKEWTPTDGVLLEEAARFVVAYAGNILVSAGPGSGKTEMLAQKAAFLLSTQRIPFVRKILAISFKKDAAVNLSDRVVKRCGEEGRMRFVSRTYDAFAKSLLDRFRMALPEEIRPAARYVIGEGLAALETLEAIGCKGWSRETLEEFVKSLDFELLAADTSTRCGSYKIWKSLVKGVGSLQPCLTYQMIMRLATFIVQRNQLIAEAIRCAFSHVMLDEFQDTTNAQYELLNACFSDKDTGIVAVGDEDQRIMKWAGAVPEIFDKFCADYKAIHKRLLCNHRSSQQIIRLQKEIFKKLHPSDEYLVVGSDSVSASPGVVKLIESANEYIEATRIAEEIRADIDAGTKPRDIGILCRMRTDRFLDPIRKALWNVGVEVRDESKIQDLLKAPLTILLIDAFSLILKINQGSVRNRLVAFLLDLRGVDYENSKEVRKCIEEIAIMQKECAAIVARPVVGAQFDLLIRSIMRIFDAEKIKRRFAEYQNPGAFKMQMNEIYNTLAALLNSNAGDFRVAFKKFIGESVVPLMTIHKSKGLEFECVYFLGLEDRKFFNMHSAPEDETKAFYVALSRAKRKLVFTFCKLRDLQLQSHEEIMPLYDILRSSGVAEIMECS